MGQKVHPTGFRLGTTEQWRSRWYADKDYAQTLGNDLAIRKFLTKRLERAALSRVDIERAGEKVPHAAEGHERISGGTLKHVGVVRRGDEGVRSLENDDRAVALHEAAYGGRAVGLNLVNRAVEQAGGLADVRGEDEGAAFNGLKRVRRAQACEDCESACVNDESSGAGKDVRDERFAVWAIA